MKCISIFKCNPQIEVIDKSHCSLEDVPNFQNYSRSLEELFLDANKLTNLNENVFRLTKLRRFSFSDNVISDIPPDIAKLVNLIELDCSRNKIQAIPEQIKFLRGLQVCDFSANEIEYLPSGLVQLKNLTCLTLNYCLIKNLPEDFGLLKNLESLELRENELETLPASITSLESLKKLDVGRNRIFRLPDDIGRLTKLEYLLVDGNCLESIPSKIGKLENLQCLDLGQQYPEQLKFLPDEISGLTSLTDLHLSDNHIEKLPDGIRYLKNLTIFKVDNNFLTELNPNIGGCVSLQELVLTSNQIDDIPSSIGALTELRSFNADSNAIEELPPQIGNLKQLGILSLRDNLLTQLPKEIGQLEMASVIDVSGNYLEYLPISMTALNLKALWLSKNQAQPLPKLQIDELPESGTKVLTCYLLPQYNEKEGELEQSGGNNNSHEEYPTNDENARPAAVSFDTAALDDTELSADVNFVRHDTPHPRELKARHQKLFNNTNKPELKGHDNASFSLVDQPKDYEQTFNEPEAYQQQQQLANCARIEPPLEYESNGLPEVPVNLTRPTVPIQPPTSILSQLRNNYPQDLENNHEVENENYSYSIKNNGSGNYAKDRQYDTSRPVDEKMTELSGQVIDILVRRSKNHTPGLGLSIAGGKDTPPYKDNDEGIFVSKVTPGGPAEAAGVRIGDKILAVNSNIFYDGITHHKAVSIFKKVKPDYMEFTMRVYRDPEEEAFDEAHDIAEPDAYSTRVENLSTNSSKMTERNTSTFTRTYTIPVATESNGTGGSNLRQFLSKEQTGKTKSNASTLPPGMSLSDNSNSINKNIIYTTLVKDYKHDLGLVLENRSDNDSKSTWSNLVIADILPNSIASRDGKLQVEDRLISINGADVTGVDVDRVMLMLEGTDRFVRVVVARGEGDDPIGAALRNMPVRPPLGSWFSSTSNMSHRPSLIESYQRPTFGSVTSLQKQPQLLGTKPPKPPKPSHLLPKDSDEQSESDDNPIARPRGGIRSAGASFNGQPTTQIDDPERRAWRRERMKSIDDDVEMVKMITEAQRRRREEKE